ncbi:ARM repeat-containing protein [Linnemannia elongata AG-77]|uniref:ARM repeat-containing protein n=1 Tax=Linnemannia elongata AG-77 TaxID=1314771 RepID=A0A197JQ14_9FUNG|nr:ARM repeat-containing protein [Linnemannia elongata AG-77]
MTLTPHEVAVSQLATDQTVPLDRIKSLRFIKNSIIGNKTKKDLYIQLGIVSRLQDIISTKDDKDSQLKIQAVIVLGSFAFGNESNILALTNSGVVEPLLNCLNPSGDPKLIEAAARTLNAIYASPKVSRQQLFMGNHLHVLVQLLDTFSSKHRPGQDIVQVHTAELVASILARCCETLEQQMQIADSGAIPLLMRLLASGISKSQEAALGALAALVKDNPELAQVIAQMRLEKGERPAPFILRLVRDKSPTMRLAAATCLTYLNRAGVIPEHNSDIMLTVLPILVKMLQLTGAVQETAPQVLAHLIWESENMQKAVCDMEAIPKLASIISQMDEEDNVYGIVGQKDKLKENSLLALAAISQLKEDCRKQVIEAKVLSHIVSAMSHPSVGVRAAACQCTRSLSRSVKNLRTSLVDAGIENPLFQLLSDEDLGVLRSATATLCNIVLDVSPMKKTIMERGIVSKFVRMISYGDNVVRLNTVWAIKNLVFEAESEVKENVMRQFGYNNLVLLLNDSEPAVQEQALNLVRNLAHKREHDIEQVFRGLGNGQLLSIIEEKLSWDDPRLLEHALYVLVNIATGNEYHKQSILKRQGILRSVLRSMNHESAAIRVASIWVIINLTWQDDKVSHSVHECVTLLRSMGVEDRLLALNADHDLDVRDRVKTALQHFLMDQQQYGHNNNGNGVPSNPTGTGIGRHGHPSSRYHDPQQQQQQENIPSSSSSSGDAFGGGAGSAMDTTHIVTGGPGAGGHDRR